MRPTIESLQADDILATILTSGDWLGSPPVRRKWARAIVRRVADGTPWSSRFQRSLYVSTFDALGLENRHRRLVDAVGRDERYRDAIGVAMGLGYAGDVGWLDSGRRMALVSALRAVCEAHERVGREGDTLAMLRVAVDSLQKRRKDVLKGLLITDVVRFSKGSDRGLARVRKLAEPASTTEERERRSQSLKGMLGMPYGFVAASLLIAENPKAVDPSRADGWVSLFDRAIRLRLDDEKADVDEYEAVLGLLRDWRDAVRQRQRDREFQTWRDRQDTLPIAAEASADAGTDDLGVDIEAAPTRASRVCVPKLADKRRHDAAKVACAGKALEVRTASMSDLLAFRRDMLREFPWLEDVVRQIFAHLFVRAGEEIRIRPILLLGPPGCGKTALIRRISDYLEVPRVIVDATRDDSGCDIGGTSARWATSQPTTMALAFDRHKVGTLLVHVDELEKAPHRQDESRITALWDVLLTLLEPSTAGRVPDAGLGVDLDCSGVSWICTANSLRGLPAPLIDRLQVLRCASPTREHVGVLAASIARRIMADRGMAVDAVEPFDDLEAKLIARIWKGGSIRVLGRIVEAMIDARQSFGAPSIH